MTASARKLTMHAYLTNFNGSYISLPILLIAAIVAIVSGINDGRFGEMLLPVVLANISIYALITGTTLTEIKVKPLSWCMPGQERAMGPAIVVLATLIALSFSALLLVNPADIADAERLQQFVAAFAWSLSLYLGIVLVAVLSRDTVLISWVLPIAIMTILPAAFNDTVYLAWRTVTYLLVHSLIIAVPTAALLVMTVLQVLASRERSRTLCGAPFLPLKAMDNPFRVDEFRKTTRAHAFRTAGRESDGAIPGVALFLRAVRPIARSALGHALHDAQWLGRSRDVLMKLLMIGTMICALVLLFDTDSRERQNEPAFLIFALIVMLFMMFAPNLRARLSPMLPTSRSQHFRTLLIKCLLSFGSMIVAIRFLQLLAAGAGAGLGVESPILVDIAAMPFKSVLIVAFNVPVLCWFVVQFRSAAASLLFAIVLFPIAATVTMISVEKFTSAPLTTLIQVGVAAWIPFLICASWRCFKSDLYHP